MDSRDRLLIERFAAAVLFIAGLLAAPLVPGAQAAGTLPQIGYLGVSPSAANAEPFRQGLRELGWVDGQNIRIEYRWTEGKTERLPGLVAELIRLKVDVIYAPDSVAAAQAAKQATTTIPIVFTTPADPIRAGLVASLARPGGNITGIGGEISGSKRLALLKEAVPKATRVAILWNPTNPAHNPGSRELESAARALQIRLHAVEVSRVEEFEAAFSAMAREHTEALYVPGDALFFLERARVVALAARARLPAMFIYREAVEAGGLMAYQQDRSDVPRRAAWYIDRALKGARLADLPIELPTKFKLSVNLKTAKALGLTVPPSVLVQADEVLE